MGGDWGSWGGGREGGKGGASFCHWPTQPPKSGVGQLGESGLLVGGVGPPDLIHLYHQKSSLCFGTDMQAPLF